MAASLLRHGPAARRQVQDVVHRRAKEAFLSPTFRPGQDFDARGLRYAYAESDDGIRWRKPKLGLVEFRGSRDNNLILVPHGFVGYHTLVLHDPDEKDATRRFKMLALVMEFGEYKTPWGKNRAYVPLYSADGLRWRVAEEILDPADPKAFSSKVPSGGRRRGLRALQVERVVLPHRPGGPARRVGPQRTPHPGVPLARSDPLVGDADDGLRAPGAVPPPEPLQPG